MKKFMKRSIAMKAIGLSVALLIVFVMVWQRSRVTRAAGPTISLTELAGGFNNPIGVDVYEPTGELIASANYPTGSPNNLDIIHANGTHTPYSSLAGLTDELKIATVRSSPCMGGFAVGDLFTGNGQPGQIVKVASGGGTVLNPWVILPGETAAIRGSLYQDRACAFGGDLIVVTGNEQTDASPFVGNVWRINSAGVATKIAELGHHLEGVVTIPNDPSRYGPLAGRILAGAEDLDVSVPGQLSYGPNGRIYGIGPSNILNGDVITIGADDGFFLNFPTSSPIHPEDIDLMRKNATFFGVAFADGKILTAPSSDFDAFCDDILITQELPSGHFPNNPPAPGVSGLSVLKFNSSSSTFDIVPLMLSNQNQVIAQWEHVTFLTGSDCITVLPCPAGSFTFSQDASGNLNIIYDQFPAPNDNSYGVNSVGWPGSGRKFSQLVGSDHAGFQLKDQNGVVRLSFNIDYITAKTGTPSGYASLGPFDTANR